MLSIQACRSASRKLPGPLGHYSTPFSTTTSQKVVHRCCLKFFSFSSLWDPSLPGFPPQRGTKTARGKITSDCCLLTSNLFSFLILSGLSLTFDTVGHPLLLETLPSLSFHTAQFPGLSASLLALRYSFYWFLFLPPASVTSVLVSVF